MPAFQPKRNIQNRAIATRHVCHVTDTAAGTRPDCLAVEEPLEIRLIQVAKQAPAEHSVSVTMRTPGQDRELAAGFLFTEGIVAGPEQIHAIHLCKSGNVVRVFLEEGIGVDLTRLERHFYTSSSCGVCGKTSVEATRVKVQMPLRSAWPVIEPQIVRAVPAALRAAQVVFDRTGGLHASALFDTSGKLQCLCEDVGRHNALDKLIGSQFLEGKTPLGENLLLVSGRVSFELVQKALVAGIPILAAVGAPSSLAVDLATAHDMTLIGFVRGDGFNVYSGVERIRTAESVAPADRVPLTVM